VSTGSHLAEDRRSAEAASARGDWLAAGELWQRVWLEGGAKDPRSGCELARALYRQGDTDGAGKVIEASLKLAPEDPELHELSGDVLVAESRWVEAAAAYESVTAVDPKRARAWRRLGELRLRADDASGAMDALERAATLEPHQRGIFPLLADAAARAGDPERTMHALARAIGAGEATAAVLASAGKLGAERALRGDPNFAPLAIDWLGQAVALDPQNAESWLWLGRLRRLRLEAPFAIEAFRRAIELEPTNIDALVDLAELYSAERIPDQAAAFAQRALDLEPDDAYRARIEKLLPAKKAPAPATADAVKS
jgi:cytochrome c-type biogenesis protein CcmH/NrfG